MSKRNLHGVVSILLAATLASFLLGCVPAEGRQTLRMNVENVTLFPGVTDRLVAVLGPSQSKAIELTWLSSDPSVASVDGSGTVLARAIGSSEISATDGKGLFAYCLIQVRNLPVFGTTDEAVLPDYKERLGSGNLPTGLVAVSGDPLPTNVDLRRYVGNGWDQGDQGSCVSFALAEYMTYEETRNAGLLAPDSLHLFAPAFIYNQLAATSYSGITMDSGLAFIMTQGDCLESLMAYVDNPFPKIPTQAATDNAMTHRISSYSPIPTDTATIKLYLGHGMPISIVVVVYPDLVGLNDSNPVYDTEPVPITRSLGYHALLLVGYDDNADGGRGAFLFRNSWGDAWGVDGGDGYIAYDFFPIVANVAYRIGDLPVPSPDLVP